MSEHDWMTALETAKYIRLGRGGKDRSLEAAFREFLKGSRAYGYPEPSLRMGPKRPLWNRPAVDKWLADGKANKEAKAALLENPPPLTGAAKAALYREDEDEPRPLRERLD